MGQPEDERSFTTDLNKEFEHPLNNQKIISVTTGGICADGTIYSITTEFKDPGFSKLEIEYMKRYESRYRTHGVLLWQRAFEYYNTYHAPSLKMTCSKCYAIVLHFIINQTPSK